MYYLLIIYQGAAKWPLTKVTDTPDVYRSARLIWNKTSLQEEVYNLMLLRLACTKADTCAELWIDTWINNSLTSSQGWSAGYSKYQIIRGVMEGSGGEGQEFIYLQKFSDSFLASDASGVFLNRLELKLFSCHSWKILRDSAILTFCNSISQLSLKPFGIFMKENVTLWKAWQNFSLIN